MSVRSEVMLGMLMLGLQSGQAARAVTLNDSWTVEVNGQAVRVNPDGSFMIANISAADLFGPGGPGTAPDFVSDDYVRLVGHSTVDGVTHYVFSDGFRFARGQVFTIGNLNFTDTPPPIPVSLTLSASPITLNSIGQTAQMRATANLGGGATQDVTPRASWTTYRTSNPGIARVNQDGLVTAYGPGAFLITATNGGATGVLQMNVVPGDPLTTVEGFVQRQSGAPVANAIVRLSGLPNADTTDAAGHFLIVGVATRVVNPIQATAVATVGDSTLVGEGSAPPVPGGITDLGIIVVTPVMAFFETDLGTKYAMGDDSNFQFTFGSGFSFPLFGTTWNSLYVGSNGYVTFGGGDNTYSESLGEVVSGLARISAFFDDLYPPSAPADGGVFVNQHPDRLVVTWNKLPHFYNVGSFTIQAVLHSDGRIQLGYRGISNLGTGVGVGVTPGGSPPYRTVDFTAGPVTGGPGEAIAEMFTSTSLFDLDQGFLLLTPVGAGYSVQFIPPAPPVGFARVVGTVQDAVGRPLANCRLVTTLSAGGTCLAASQSGGDGTFRVDHVPLGGMLQVAAYDPAHPNAPPMTGWVRPLQNRRTYAVVVNESSSRAEKAGSASGRQKVFQASGSPSSGRPLPLTLTLEEPRPNPFGSEVVTSFGLPRSGPVTLAAYDVTGRRVATLVDGRLEAGWHSRAWNGTDNSGATLGSGVYFLRLKQKDVVKIRRVALVR